MDLVRSLAIPQSTMSETLSALVDIGILMKDPSSRMYSATARLAALGLCAQPANIANGVLFQAMRSCAADLGTPIGLFGICDRRAQLYHLISPPREDEVEKDIFPAVIGAFSPLHSSAVGHVLLAALGSDRYMNLLWRLRAESKDQEDFGYSSLCRRLESVEILSWAEGSVGFDTNWRAIAILVPKGFGAQPLALAAVHPDCKSMSSSLVVEKLRAGLVVPKESIRLHTERSAVIESI